MRIKTQNILITVNFFILAIVFCGFAAFFLATGYDEIWNGNNIWWLGVIVFSISFIFGILSLYITTKSLKLKF